MELENDNEEGNKYICETYAYLRSVGVTHNKTIDYIVQTLQKIPLVDDKDRKRRIHQLLEGIDRKMCPKKLFRRLINISNPSKESLDEVRDLAKQYFSYETMPIFKDDEYDRLARRRMIRHEYY